MSEETTSPRRGPGRPSNAEKEQAEAALSGVANDAPIEAKPDADVAAEVQALRDEIAALRAEKEAAEAANSTVAPKEGKFIVHFVRDGLMVLGNMTYRGQELEFDTNEQNYKDTQDANGFSFLELRRDPQAQEALYGKEFFREGPWTGKSFADIKYETLKRLAAGGNDATITARELDELDQLDKKRRRKLDPLPPLSLGAPIAGRRSGY